MAKGIRRRELREPDEFLTLSRRALDYAKANERKVTLAAIGLVAVLALALGVRSYRAWQDERAREAFAAAYLDFTAGRLDQALAGFAGVQARWPSTSSARLALLYGANAAFDAKKDREAEQQYAKLLAASTDGDLRQIAHYNLGLLRARAGDPQAALEHFREASAVAGPLRGAAWLERIRGLSKSGTRPEDAAVALREIGDALAPETRQYLEAKAAAAKPSATEPAGD